MERSFDLGALLKNHEKKHKSKPSQFVSVAGGVTKRLENNIKYRKSSRLTVFDSIRNLQRCESPAASAPVSDKQTKLEHRRLQLEKWKEEKEKRKKEQATQKKKPFVAGVPHAPLKYVPPPPPKPMPSTSGRVTRSQTSKAKPSKVNDAKVKKNQSFAPNNASFRPPEIKTLTKVPLLAPLNKKNDKKNKTIITFEPVIPSVQKTRSKTQPYKVETLPNQEKTKAKTTKVTNKPVRITRNTKNVASSSDMESSRSLHSSTSQSSFEQMKNLQINSSSDIDNSQNSSANANSDFERKVVPQTSSSTDTDWVVTEKSPVTKKTPRKSIQRKSKSLTPKNPIPKSESSSEERLRSPKFVVDGPMTPEQSSQESIKISPCVTMSRGKDNARREMKKKMEEGLLDDDASDMDSVDHFRRQLASEIKRMTEMCEVWDKIAEQVQLPELVQEAVLTATGQARLLMSAKLQQFASLVERCAKPEAGAALVTPADLHGFWDMVFMQVENVDMRFKKLEEMKARGWAEEKPVEVKKKVVKPNVKKPAAKPAGGPSRLREMIAAARKAKKQEETTAIVASSPGVTPAVPDADADAESKTFEAGFFCVKSPVRSPAAPSTPNNKNNLLKAVLSSEAKKATASATKSSTSFAMLRASVLSKNVEYDGIAPLEQTPVHLNPINLYATPGRSILKSNAPSTKKSGKKSIKVVLFDQSDADLQDTSITDKENEPKTLNKSDMDLNLDSGLSSLDIEKEVEKENKGSARRKSKLMRQDATEDRSPVMTRSRRKSAQVDDEKTPRRSSRKKALQEVNEKEFTPKRASRSRKSVNMVLT